MILKGIEMGLAPERIAQSLDINVERIRERQQLLKGIAPEVVTMLKDRMVSQGVFTVLRKMKPMRQIVAAEMMVSASRFTVNYARMILATTRPEQLAASRSPPPASRRRTSLAWNARWKSCIRIIGSWRTRSARPCWCWWLPRAS